MAVLDNDTIEILSKEEEDALCVVPMGTVYSMQPLVSGAMTGITFVPDEDGAPHVEKDGLRLTLVDSLYKKKSIGIFESQFLLLGLMRFATKNHMKGTKGKPKLNTREIIISEADLANFLDENYTSDKEKSKFHTKIVQACNLFNKETLKWKDSENNYIGDVGIYCIPDDGVVFFYFPNPLAKALINSPTMSFGAALFALDRHNITAYQLAMKLSLHYYMNSNYTQGIYRTLSVDKLLEVCTSLPSYEHVEATGQSWRRLIKNKFEKSLDDLVKQGVLSEWRYTNSKEQPLTEQRQKYFDKRATYHAWRGEAMIYFDMKNPIDRAAEIKTRDARIRQAKSRKNKRKTGAKNCDT